MPDPIKQNVQAFDDNLPDNQRNPQSKEAFDELMKRAAQPEQPSKGTQAQSDDYNDTQTRSRSSEDT